MGRSAEQSPFTGYEPKGFMAAGSNIANTTSRKPIICSTTTERDELLLVKIGREAT